MRTSAQPSRVEMQPQDSTGLLLRELSRRRLLEEMLRKVLDNGALQTIEVAVKSDGHVVLVVDKFTLRMLTAVCQIQDLTEEGVRLVERIDYNRDALPSLDAIYFVTPTDSNVRQLTEDATRAGKKGKYNSFHVFFTHKISDPLLKLIAASRETVLQIGSFAETNLSFVTFDSRTFHFADETVFEKILKEDSKDVAVSTSLDTIADRLATVFASLGVLQPKIRIQRSGAGKGMNAAGRLGLNVQLRLNEIECKGPLFRQEQVPAGPHTLIIMERSYDWPAVLAHDFHYEAATYDLLGDGAVSIEEGVYRHRSGATEKSFNLADDKDALWRQCRHKPLWIVRDYVVEESQKWKTQDTEMRGRSAASSRSSNVATMANRAMSALQSLPEHKERFAKLEVHTDIILKIDQLIEGHHLTEVGAFEQEMLTGVDSQGNTVMPRRIKEELEIHLRRDLPDVVKQRLVMLFCSCESVGRDSAYFKAIARIAREEMKRIDAEIATNPLWHAKAAMSVDANDQIREKKRAFYKKRVRNLNSEFPKHGDISARLTRWQPKIREVMEQTATNCLSHDLFPELRAWISPEGDEATSANPPRQSSPTNPASGLVIVYVVGGLTLTEARQAHEVSQALQGVEVFAGGDCILTARTLTEALKRHADDDVCPSFR